MNTMEIPRLQKVSSAHGASKAVGACCTPPRNESSCCTPVVQQKPSDACCLQPADGSACCHK